MKTLIIENDINSQDLLVETLTQYCHAIEIIGIETDIDNGVKKFMELKPDLIFLEIDVSDGNGFDFLSLVDHSRSIVIIVSHNDSYGIKAIKASVFDYFIKPFSVVELSQAVINAKIQFEAKILIDKINASNEKLLIEINDSKLLYKDAKGYKLIDTSLLSHISVNKPYSRLFLSDGSSFLMKFTLTAILAQLPNYFYKIHNSHAVNLRQVQEWTSGRGGNVIMQNKLSVPLSYRLKKDFKQQIKNKLKPLHS